MIYQHWQLLFCLLSFYASVFIGDKFSLYFSVFGIADFSDVDVWMVSVFTQNFISNIFSGFLETIRRNNRDIGPAVRVFANGPGDLGSIPGRVIPKTLKMELDTTLLNTQHYKVRFKGKVEQSREWSSALPYTLV